MIPLDKESRVHALGAEYKLKSSTGKPSNLFDKSVIHAVVSVRERNGGDCERGKFTRRGLFGSCEITYRAK